MSEFRKKFVSLDLETTHLSPQEGKIMEVGAVEVEIFFDDKKKELVTEFGKSFTSLINPEIEVPIAALEITGIKQDELNIAPRWSAIRKQVEEFVADKILLGQNLEFDLAFLTQQGVRLKNNYIDTLEIAQTIIPNARSHALDYLTEVFKIPRTETHRALDDAQATAYLLTHLLHEFLSLPVALREEISIIFSRANDLRFAELFASLPEREKLKSQQKKEHALKLEAEDVAVEFEDQEIIKLPLNFARQQEWLLSLAQKNQSLIIAVAHPVYLSNIPLSQRLFSPIWSLDNERFELFLSSESLNSTSVKLLAKLLIARSQHHEVDLSLVRFTREEKAVLSSVTLDAKVKTKQAEQAYQLKKKQVYFVDLTTLFVLSEIWGFAFESHKLVLFDFAQIESQFNQSVSRKLNLRTVREKMKVLYPIDRESLSVFLKVPPAVEKLSNELDLFFGILHLIYLKAQGEFSQNQLVDELEAGSDRFRKLEQPAKKLLVKLQEFTDYLSEASESMEERVRREMLALRGHLEEYINFINEFFLERSPQSVYWLNFNADWVDLYISPESLIETYKKFTKKFRSVSIVETELPVLSLNYYQKRLGLQDYRLKTLETEPGESKFSVHLFSREVDFDKLLAILQPNRSTAIIVPNENQLAKYYEGLTRANLPNHELVAYKFSGSLGVIKSRLAHPAEAASSAAKAGRSSSLEGQARSQLLLLTSNIYLRSFPQFPYFDDLIILKLPFEPPSLRPISLPKTDNDFLDYSLPRALHQLHLMLIRFVIAKPGLRAAESQNNLRRIILLDPRTTRQYDEKFIEYLEDVTEFDLKIDDNSIFVDN